MEHEVQSLSAETQLWLETRRRSGNWIQIAAADEIPSDILGWDRTILHMFQITFGPEIEKRLAENMIGDNFVLLAAQMLQPEEGEQVVRLNDEVRGLPLVRLGRSVTKGESVLVSDMRDLVSFDVEEDELDSGHFTMFWNGSGWSITFDFRSGRAKSAQMIESARQFVAAAQYCAEQRFYGPSVDNLFSACELLSKAHLILHRSQAVKAKSHGAVSSALNNWGRLGNIDGDFLKLFNRMSNARSTARYNPAAQISPPVDTEFSIIQGELDRLDRAVVHRTKDRVLADEIEAPIP